MDDYVDFFKKLKKGPGGKPNPARVLMTALAGPTDRVEVGVDGKNPTLKPSCQTAQGFAVPAIRIKTLVHAFAKPLSATAIADIKAQKSNLPCWIDKQGVWREENFSTICSSDFSPALKRLGERIEASLDWTSCAAPRAPRGRTPPSAR